MTMQTFICMKWGTPYGPEYVNRLHNSIQRFTDRPSRLICFTDDSTGVDAAVTCHPLPPIDLPEAKRHLPWRKVGLLAKTLADLQGEVIFLDLDVVITGDLDRFFDYHSGEYCVIQNWTQPAQDIGNTTCFKIEVGRYAEVYDKFQRDPEQIIERHSNEQIYISHELANKVYWPKHWCVSFKHSLIPPWPLRLWQPAKLPEDTSLVAFTGKPEVHDAVEGHWPVKPGQGWKKIYKKIQPVSWVSDYWKDD